MAGSRRDGGLRNSSGEVVVGAGGCGTARLRSFCTRSHVTGAGHSPADKQKWGRSWQSSLWVGASGLAGLLVWDHLDGEVRALVERMVVEEANRKIGVKPRDA